MSLLRNVYLVTGSTGEYSDHSEWVVAAYPYFEQAEQHAKLANDQLREAGLHADAGRVNRSEGKEFVGKFSLDRDCHIDYTGTVYVVQVIPMVAHVDEYMELYSQ